jgi:hypothetical protein
VGIFKRWVYRDSFYLRGARLMTVLYPVLGGVIVFLR